MLVASISEVLFVISESVNIYHLFSMLQKLFYMLSVVNKTNFEYSLQCVY